MSSTPALTATELIAFVVHEARLLDERRWDDWYDLFTEDGRYWIPLQHDQTSRLSHHSLMDEDRLLLRLRIDRLGHARAFSQQPASRSQHFLQTPQVERLDSGPAGHLMRTAFLYLESRADVQQVLGGVAWHTLVVGPDGALKIREKRINLLNCDAALPPIQLFL